jgi:hypothetical protein
MFGFKNIDSTSAPLGARDVPVAFGTPDVIAGAHFALVVDEAALENKGLLDLDMLVQCQLAPRLPAEEGGQKPGCRVFQQHLHVDPRARGRPPWQGLDLDIARSKGPELLGLFQERRGGGPWLPPGMGCLS